MKTEIIFIADKSGSMGKLRQAVVSGFNAFLAEQRLIPGEARMTMVQFNSTVNTLYQARPLAEVFNLTEAQYCPVGGTALHDAIGQTLEVQGKRIAAENWAEVVIVNISTDGEENSSSEYSLEQVRAMISHAQDKAGWIFLFQAANVDAFAVGGQYGISAGTTHSFQASSAGVADSYSNMSLATTRARSVTPGADPGALLNVVANTPLPQSQPSGVLPDAVA
jgi:uncharacterized protein YegL